MDNFHYYYPPENPIPISQTPTTSAHTTPATGMSASQTSVTSTTSTTSTISSTPTTVHCSSHTVPREAHRSHTVFASIALVESLTKTNLLLVADMKSELQSIHK